jgi:1,5-anhydro-D-fructose reductase (1,5-anhydro-D-mannitol-forming)
MIRVGIVGLGFMGKMHFGCYKQNKNVQIVAICDVDKKKFNVSDGAVGNIKGADKPLDFTGIVLYTDFDEMLDNANLDAVSITVPTYLHCAYTLNALKRGIHVLCEKPMALNSRDAKKMVVAAKQSGKLLQVGHCIRFWPEYVKLKEIIDSGKYGKVLAANFQRLSLTPTWNWDNWMLNSSRSGGASLDLHIHDVDYIQYVFKMPKAIFSRGVKGPSGGFDHMVTNFVYDNKVITAEGGWVMMPKFGFEMSFKVALEKATIIYSCLQDPGFKICPTKGEVIVPKIEKKGGHALEIEHFIKAISGKSVPKILTPTQSYDSICLVEAAEKSARSGKSVTIA